jgi:uncharacterized membrane protein
MMNPFDADAAQSGGRSGGSSFRSSPSRSSTRLGAGSRSSSGYSSGYSSPRIMPMPVYTPMYGGYGGGFGFGFNPFGFMPINLNVLIIAGVAYFIYNSLQNRAGGSDFSGSDEDSGMLGSGATVIKLQLSLDSDWKSGNIQETLAQLAAKNAAMSSRSDIATLLSEASIALLRRQNDWEAVAFESKKFGAKSEAEPAYQRLAVTERSKFEEESNGASALMRSSADSGASTKAVVSLVVAMRGRSGAALKSVRSVVDIKTVLQNLAADSLTDEGENVMAVEVLWTPSDRDTVLSDRDIVEDYPELIRL